MRSSKTSLDSKEFNFLIALINGDAEFFGCLVIHGAIVTGWEAGRKNIYRNRLDLCRNTIKRDSSPRYL
jgi:hypothetical protein